MTLREFYKNPGNVPTLILGSVKYGYTTRYNAVVNRLKKKVKVTIYEESELSYYFHLLIPSDTRELYYDVVIHFYAEKSHISFKDWEVEFFSNCPSFVYNYAFVYRKNKLFIENLYDKLGELVLENKPSERNPSMLVMFDKSIFYAVHFIMTSSGYSQRYFVKKNAVKFSKNIFNNIRSFSKIMSLISEHSKMKAHEITRKLKESKKSVIKKKAEKTINRIKKITGKKKI